MAHKWAWWLHDPAAFCLGAPLHCRVGDKISNGPHEPRIFLKNVQVTFFWRTLRNKKKAHIMFFLKAQVALFLWQRLRNKKNLNRTFLCKKV